MTQMDEAKKGIITEEMKAIAKEENVPEDFIRRGVANGRIIIPNNINREVKPVGIGEGLRTKVNATIGTSTDIVDLKMEEEKAKIAIENKADTLMELSVGGDLDKIRKRILEISQIPVGSVPVYQAAIETIRKKGAAIYMDEDIMFKTIEKQAKDGIDFMAIHCSINMETLKRLKRQGREGGLVSRGGAFISAWIVENETENPLYKDFDYIQDRKSVV